MWVNIQLKEKIAEEVMDIIYKEVQGLDFFVILNLGENIDSELSDEIKSELQNWCSNAIEQGYGDGHMHYVYNLDYSKEHNQVFAFIDMGSMNPEIGFYALSDICKGINKKYNNKVICNIEINGTDEILNILSQF